MRFSVFTLALLVPAVSSANCKASCSGTGANKLCTFTAALDIHASETGYYEFEECGDVHMPTLEMEQGVTYKFVQNTDTNWFHPLGFAYFPDGAHSGVDELEPGISQSGSTCVDDETCQAPRYFHNGVFLGGTYDNTASSPVGGDDFGLDVFEPQFQLGRGDWQDLRDEGSGYEVQLTITDTDYQKDLFYFCHVHTRMSGRIVVVDNQGKAVNPNPSTPELGYDYHSPSTFDKSCGTYDTGDFQRSNNMCPGDDFIFCDGGATGQEKLSSCMYALDCHMQHSMRVKLDADPMAAFMHQMIPHHQNAVNMAKVILKMGVDSEKDKEGDVEAMLYSIVNLQNKQINMMNGWLEEYGYDSSTDVQCGDYKTADDSSTSSASRFGQTWLHVHVVHCILCVVVGYAIQ